MTALHWRLLHTSWRSDWETYQLAQKSPERQNTQVFNWCPVSWTAYQLDPGEGKLMQICKWRTINISLKPRRPIWAASAHITALNGMKMVEEVTAGDDSADGHDGAGQGTVCIFPSPTYPMPAPGTRLPSAAYLDRDLGWAVTDGTQRSPPDHIHRCGVVLFTTVNTGLNNICCPSKWLYKVKYMRRQDDWSINIQCAGPWVHLLC